MFERLLALTFVGVGVLAVVLSVAGRPTVPNGWVVTTGTVVGFVTVSSSDGATQAAVVEYRDGAGQLQRVKSNASFGLGLGDKLGDEISVAYDPSRPSSGRLLSGTASWAWLVGTGMGVLFAVIGGALLWREMRPQPRSDEAALSGTAPAGALVETSRLAGFGYSFPRARTRLLLDLVIAPAMAVMFGAFAVLLFSQGGWLVIIGIAAIGATLLLLYEVVFDVKRGLFVPAAEVGPSGIWLRGIGAFAWKDLTEVRHERFASSAGEGLAMYDRLALVPRDRGREVGASASTARIANRYHDLFVSLAGRRPITIAPIGLMGYEVADFDSLLARVGEYFPVTEVSDEPSRVGEH